MYTITHDGRPFFDPSTNGFKVEAPQLTLEANKIASMDLTVYPNNPEFEQIKDHTSTFAIYQDGTLMMKLRPAYRKNTFAGGATWRCEELAAKLDDVFHRPDYFTGTVAAYLAHIIEYYQWISGDTNVRLGNVLYKATETDTFINDEYEGHWQAMMSHVVDVYGGYILPRYEGDYIYIDYLSDEDLPVCGQTIRFGKNMADMFLETESSEMFSVLIPLGPDVDVSNPQPGQASSRPMNIGSVNGGLDYLESAEGIALYGRREKTQTWESATDAADLKAKGQAYLAEHAVKLKKTITLSAADLHNLNVNIAAIGWMQRIPILSEPHEVDTQYTATKLTIPLGVPDLLQLQMGEPKEVFTDRVPPASITGRSSGGRSGRAAGSGDVSHWEKIVSAQRELLKNTGIYKIWQSGIVVDAEQGTRLFSIEQLFTEQQGVLSEQSADLVVKSNQISTLVQKTGINSVGENETLYSRITQTANEIASEVTRARGVEGTLSSRITQTEEGLESKVSYTSFTGNEIASRINQTATTILLSASKINLEGYVTASELSATNANIANLVNGSTTAQMLKAASLEATSVLTVANKGASWHSVTKAGFVSQTEVQFLGDNDLSLAHYHSISASENNGVVSFTLGAPQRTEGSTNFNIAATQFYKDGVAAAASAVTITGAARTAGPTFSSTYKTAYIDVTSMASNGATGVTQNMAIDVSDAWDAGEASVTVDNIARRANDLRSGTNILVYPRATASNGATHDETFTVDASAVYTAGQNAVTVSSVAKNGDQSYADDNKTITVPVLATASNGKTKSEDITVDATATYNLAAWNYAAVGATKTGNTSWASNSKSCTIQVTVLDRQNRSYGPYSITVDTTKAYSDGWTKGFQDGIEA